ncbi:hypothetical protein Psi01_24010 [Planobispora siamensis]|uniref:Uncharacterized protein n=1 Tax=Planobispora siamensis TaxID=936338 RepID=A0A8J3WLF3_9ACTN|nr:hypothetical protein Psi01_24010 [Planobispora siamensis]
MLPRASGTAWAVPVSAACTSRAAASRATFLRRSRARIPSFLPGTAGVGVPAEAALSGAESSDAAFSGVTLPGAAFSGTAGASENHASASAGAAEAPRSSGSARSG